MLLDHGALLNTPGSENSTPLHDAVENYRLDCVRLLIARGASTTMRYLVCNLITVHFFVVIVGKIMTVYSIRLK